MDHTMATHMQAPFRYLDGTLSPSDAAAFEEHFFSCTECAEELRITTIVAENARAVFREEAHQAILDAEARRKQKAGWWERLRLGFAVPAAATAALLIAVFYQNAITIPHLKTDVAALTGAAPFSFPLKQARGESTVSIPRQARFFMPYFYLPNHAPVARYICTFEPQSGGRTIERMVVEAPPAGQPIQVVLRHSDFPSGTYAVTVRGENLSNPIAIYRMDINTY
ncbi:MAG: zf-HC2 domain-containing protein [Terriglobales bacterium]